MLVCCQLWHKVHMLPYAVLQSLLLSKPVVAAVMHPCKHAESFKKGGVEITPFVVEERKCWFA